MSQGSGPSSGSGLNTGTGGFPIDTPGGTRAYTIDTGTTANDDATSWSPGNVSVSDVPVDVSPTTRRTLASYLSKTTLGLSPSSPSPVSNKYPVVNGPSEDPVDLKLQEVGGYSPPLTVNSNQAVFNSSFQPSVSSAPAQITFNIGRLKPKQGATKDGNDLLSTATQGSMPFPPLPGEINRAELSDPIRTYTVTTLSVNHFKEDLKFLTPTNANDEKINVRKQLDLLKATTTSGVTPMSRGNFYPVIVDSSNSYTKLTTNSGYSPPLTINTTQTSFDLNLPATRTGATSGFLQVLGRQEPSAIGAIDGNKLLRTATEGSLPFPPLRGDINRAELNEPLKTYTTTVLQVNPYGQELKFLTPTNALDEKINVKKQLDLLKRTSASGVNPMNRGSFYPINVELDSSGAPIVSVTKLTDPSGYPASLRSMVNDNQLNFRDLGTGRSNDSVDLKILRGRQQSSSGITTDGNSLLPFAADVLTGAQEYPPAGTVNVTKLSDTSPVKPYTDKLTQKNEYSEATKFSPSSDAAKRPLDALDTTPLSYPARPEDLREPRKQTLRDYMAKATSEGFGRNKYSLDSTPSNEESLRDVKGNPSSPHGASNSSKHIPDTLLSSRAVDIPNLRIGKSSKNESGIDGNNLLKDVTDLPANGPIEPAVIDGKLPPLEFKEPSGTSPAVAYSSSVIINRFNPQTQFESSGNPTNTGSALYAKKYKLGESYGPNDPARELSYGRLAQIGNVLTQRAGIELSSNESGFNPTSPTTQAKALLPGTAQLGVKKANLNDLTARSVIDTLTQAGVSGDRMIDPANESWGSLNNVNDEYSGMSAFGMQLLAVALMVGVIIIVLTFFLLFQWAGSTAGNELGPKVEGPDGRLPFGAFRFDESAKVDYSNPLSFLSAIGTKMNFWRLFGIDSTENKLSDCVVVGALSFFGVNSPETTGSGATTVALLKGALSVTSSPGYYSVVARNVSRSYLIIADAFKTLGRAFSSGLTAGIKQLFSLIETFKNSKFFKVINVFSQLGDRVILNKDPENVDNESVGPGLRHKSKIDSADLKSYGKSRHKFSDGTISLAWSATRSPSLLMKNKYIQGLGSGDMKSPLLEMNFLSGIDKAQGGSAGTTLANEKGRFDDTVREQIEESLESEYVPFYFHDVRTNEIVSFHAFLASLTDDYSVAYDNVDAFGRAEPLKIYKSTTRKIGVSFYVASVNEHDFDSMWVKINKLVTMIYPQFDQGRFLDSGNYKITVPFSQTMRAPPFIRMRIGDLITSNYSRFNLGRIFGFDNSRTQLVVSGSTIVNSEGAKIPEETIQSQIIGKIAEKKKVQGSEFKFLPSVTMTNIVFIEGPVNTQRIDVQKLAFKVKGPVRGSEDNVEGTLMYTGTAVASETKELEGKKVKVSIRSLGEIIKPTTDAIRNEVRGNDTAYNQYLSAMDSFLKDEGNDSNAVAKSFRSSGGRGLGGFIESMSFDWYDKVTWETQNTADRKNANVKNYADSAGRKAPKLCKVTISFSPVHDIAPGLDHNGINRAPIYNVRQMNSSGGRWRGSR